MVTSTQITILYIKNWLSAMVLNYVSSSIPELLFKRFLDRSVPIAHEGEGCVFLIAESPDWNEKLGFTQKFSLLSTNSGFSSVPVLLKAIPLKILEPFLRIAGGLICSGSEL